MSEKVGPELWLGHFSFIEARTRRRSLVSISCRVPSRMGCCDFHLAPENVLRQGSRELIGSPEWFILIITRRLR